MEELNAGRYESLQEGLTELTLAVDNGPDTLLLRTDSVEDLDSPESISKIDREDCFSWEEDRLHLSLSVDNDTSHLEPEKDAVSKDDHSDGTAKEEDSSKIPLSTRYCSLSYLIRFFITIFYLSQNAFFQLSK